MKYRIPLQGGKINLAGKSTAGMFCFVLFFVLLLATDYVLIRREAEWEVFGGESEVRQLGTERQRRGKKC